jgi:hypothetical protein
MSHEATLIYSEPILRRAVFAYWRRSFGVGFIVAYVVVALGLGTLVAQGMTSWLDGVIVGVLGAVLALGGGMAAVVYFIHYRNSMRKFRAMGSPQAMFLVEELSFTLSSGIGTATLQWSAVKELWQFPGVWLLLYSKAHFTTLPLASMPPQMQDFVKQHIQAAGGKIVG